MKSFHFTVFALIAVFFAVMAVVAITAFRLPSHKTGIDPAEITKLRHVSL